MDTEGALTHDKKKTPTKARLYYSLSLSWYTILYCVVLYAEGLGATWGLYYVVLYARPGSASTAPSLCS